MEILLSSVCFRTFQYFFNNNQSNVYFTFFVNLYLCFINRCGKTNTCYRKTVQQTENILSHFHFISIIIYSKINGETRPNSKHSFIEIIRKGPIDQSQNYVTNRFIQKASGNIASFRLLEVSEKDILINSFYFVLSLFDIFQIISQ